MKNAGVTRKKTKMLMLMLLLLLLLLLRMMMMTMMRVAMHVFQGDVSGYEFASPSPMLPQQHHH